MLRWGITLLILSGCGVMPDPFHSYAVLNACTDFWGFEGVVTRFRKNTLLVEGEEVCPAIGDDAWVSPEPQTEVYRMEGGRKLVLRWSDLKLGMHVKVHFDGIVYQTNPVQAATDWVEVLP